MVDVVSRLRRHPVSSGGMDILGGRFPLIPNEVSPSLLVYGGEDPEPMLAEAWR